LIFHQKIRQFLSAIKPLFEYERVSNIAGFDTVDGIMEKGKKIDFIYESNALRIIHANLGKVITLDRNVYFAEEIIFHTPSDHTIDGVRFDMEMQVIHYGRSKKAINKQVVLSFLFIKRPGSSNKFIEKLDFFNLPTKAEPDRDLKESINIAEVFYDSFSEDIPNVMPFSFYTYSGSLTFPPCTERTINYVLSDPIPLSTTAIEMFKEALRMPDLIDQASNNIFVENTKTENNRNTQKQNGRPIFYYDHIKYCGPNFVQKKKLKTKGHYEKYEKSVIEYFYVPQKAPAGLPGAFLVSENEAKRNLNLQ